MNLFYIHCTNLSCQDGQYQILSTDNKYLAAVSWQLGSIPVRRGCIAKWNRYLRNGEVILLLLSSLTSVHSGFICTCI